MFIRKLRVERIEAESHATHPCPLKWIDSFAMRNFTNDAIFDDTLPITDGLMEAGYHVPLDRLQAAMQDWLLRKGYLKPGDLLQITQLKSNPEKASQK